MAIQIKVTYDNNQEPRYLDKDEEGWFTTRQEKGKVFDSKKEAEDALKEIREAISNINAEIVGA